MAPPLFRYGRKSKKDWFWYVLFPFISHSRSGSSYHYRAFPLYLYWRDLDDDTLYLHLFWPLFRYVRKGEERKWRTLIPFVSYWSKGEDFDFRIFWKWIRSSNLEGFRTLRINPFYRKDENARGDFYWSLLSGLVSHKKTKEEDTWRVLWLIKF